MSDYETSAKSWPFEEARKLVQRLAVHPKSVVLFETGYGASGLPHIGTFGEVVRTSMIRHAFEKISSVPTRLLCVADDMDGLRKVPENIPNKEIVIPHLGKPLTDIPDPFGTHESFGHHNNARMRAFLDSFGFQYEFVSATDCYKQGVYDPMLLKVLEHYEAIMAVILPTLGEERQATYSPFLPISPTTGRVLQVPILERDLKAGTIVFEDEDGKKIEQPVTGGHCKLQWKADWGMRWAAFDVDYEISGKDLIDSVKLSSQICRILGKIPPEGFNYELFLDDKGQKISKSKGNGLTVDEWLRYAPAESLSYFMFQSPRRAKRLYFDVIPKNVDEYLTQLEKFPDQDPVQQADNPVWHIHKGKPPHESVHLSFGILLNLASVCNAHDKSILWGFIQRYAPTATPESLPILDQLVGFAIKYYEDFIQPHKTFRAPTDMERVALQDLWARLESVESSAEALQTLLYDVGKSHPFEDLKSWFQTLYQVLIGQTEGPRMGSFVALYGVEAFRQLIEEKLNGC